MKRRKRNLRNLKKLKNKTILLGVTGGVAAYKTVDLVRRLRDEEASVVVIMTGASQHFVTPLSLEVASQNKVYLSLFDEPLAHIDLPARADLMVIAPATANFISKFAHGIADDLLSTCLLSFSGRVVMAPAMNWRMYENAMVRENLNKLLAFGVRQVGPESGSLACGEEGMGRMSEVAQIIDAVKEELTGKDLTGHRVVVTAGPTREYIDPVRFISNRSSGKMGYAVAKAAKRRGAEVALISGPSALQRPSGLKFTQVESAREMRDAVQEELGLGASLLVMAAAVSDYTLPEKSAAKLDKRPELSLRLVATDDIVAASAKSDRRPFIIGFAAETGRMVERAEQKMKSKGLDMIIFNDVTEPGAGFDVDTNKVVVIDRQGRTALDLMSKDSVAEAILDRFLEIRA